MSDLAPFRDRDPRFFRVIGIFEDPFEPLKLSIVLQQQPRSS